jgi:putative ABC transport system permease protein
VIQVYLTQAIGLGLLGGVIGLSIGVGLQHVLPRALAGLLETDLLQQVEFTSGFSTAAIGPLIKGLGLGIMTTLLFSVWPLLTIRDVKPAGIFRRDFEGAERVGHTVTGRFGQRLLISFRTDPLPAVAAASIGAGLAALSVWQAGSLKIGLFFIGGLITAVIALMLSAQAFLKGLRLLGSPGPLVLRQALGNLHRPGSQTIGVMMSIGIGVMVIMTIGVIEHSLVRNIGANRPADSPTFFFIDIQPDQADRFSRLIHEQTGDVAPQLTPLVRSRVRAINGQSVRLEAETEQEEQAAQTREDKRKNWYLGREYVLTYLEELPKDNTIVKGAWWKPDHLFVGPQLSIEEDAAKHMGVNVGGTIEFEIQGVSVTAEVTSIRKVEWGNFSTNFYMILSPGSLDGAPITYVATVRVPPRDEAPLQAKVVAAFPNVTSINIGDVMETFTNVLERLALAIRAVALFCISAGALVMAAALTATRYRRLYEAVVLKAIGATRGFIAQAFAAEYALMGVVAGTVGIVMANALAWAVLRYILDLPWSLEPRLLGIGFFCTILLTLVVGFLSTYRILGQPPLAVLRHE